MLLATVIICGFFLMANICVIIANIKHNVPHSPGEILQGIAWAFLFIVNLIALVK
jgi:hypothetical protein